MLVPANVISDLISDGILLAQMELFTAAGEGDLDKVVKFLDDGAAVDEGDVWTGI